MKHTNTLTVTTLLSILLFSFHWADEISRGMEPGTVSAFWGLLILAVWLCATLVFAERRWGLVVMLLGSLLSSAVPVLHMQGGGIVGGRIAPNSGGAFFWVWTLVALGASGMLSFVLAVRALWGLRRGQPR